MGGCDRVLVKTTENSDEHVVSDRYFIVVPCMTGVY
jgi:hypothetical protein